MEGAMTSEAAATPDAGAEPTTTATRSGSYPAPTSEASAQAPRAAAIARWNERAPSLATAGSSDAVPGPKSSTVPATSWRYRSGPNEA